jgi:hypothetical protein
MHKLYGFMECYGGKTLHLNVNEISSCFYHIFKLKMKKLACNSIIIKINVKISENIKNQPERQTYSVCG